MELHQLTLRYEHLRKRHPRQERALLSSLSEIDQLLPIVVVSEAERFVLIDGYKRVRALKRLKETHAAGRPAPLRASAAEAILALPREAKRLIMAAADAVAIPTALWATLALKFDRLDPALDRTLAYFLVAIASALFFSRCSACTAR